VAGNCLQADGLAAGVARRGPALITPTQRSMVRSTGVFPCGFKWCNKGKQGSGGGRTLGNPVNPHIETPEEGTLRLSRIAFYSTNASTTKWGRARHGPGTASKPPVIGMGLRQQPVASRGKKPAGYEEFNGAD